MSKVEHREIDWYTIAVIVAGVFLAVVLFLTIFVWPLENEKQKEEVRSMSCKELQAYILHPKGWSDVAKDVYLVKCI